MATAGKKPPINLDQIEGQKGNGGSSGPQPGGLGYQERPPMGGKKAGAFGGINWTQVFLSAVVALLVFAVIFVSMGASQSDVAVLSANDAELGDRVEAAQGLANTALDAADEAKEEAQEAKDKAQNILSILQTDYTPTASLPDFNQFATKDSIAGLSTQISGMSEQLAAQIEAMKEAEAEEETAGLDIEEETKWDVSCGFARALEPQHALLTVEVDDYRVGPDEGYYDIDLIFRNSSETDTITNANPVVYIRLTPRDYVQVDEDGFYIWTLDDDVDWDVDMVERERRGVDVCRYIEFTSDSFANLPDLAPGASYEYELELELFYE